MMYLMSDIHGYSDLFFRMLEKLSFGTEDRLFIVGDLVAKGPDSLRLLRFVMESDNICLLRGNHEQRLLQAMGADLGAGISDSVLTPWTAGDGAGVLGELRGLPDGERSEVLDFLLGTRLFFRLDYLGKRYILVHGAPGSKTEAKTGAGGMDGEAVGEVFRKTATQNGLAGAGQAVGEVFGRTAGSDRTAVDVEGKEIVGRKTVVQNGSAGAGQAEKMSKGEARRRQKKAVYAVMEKRFSDPKTKTGLPEGTIAVVGHTPTFKYGAEYAGRILVRRDKILLDCGSGQGYGIGCLRLEDGAEFYVRP